MSGTQPPPQFFPNAQDVVLHNPVMANIQGNQYNYATNNATIQNIQGDQYNVGDPDSVELAGLDCARSASFNTTKLCLPDTRSDVLGEIGDWAYGPNTRRVLWLHGPAGTGKSAIGNTVAARFDQNRQLGSFFPFDQSYLAERRHEKVFSTIARDLAARNPAFKKAVADAIRERPWLKTTPDISQQWDHLLVKPAAHLVSNGLIIIVIEAVDESGDIDSRASLLSILARRTGELPPNIRILVTSRPLQDISESLVDNPDIWIKDLNDVPKHTVDHDILVYFFKQLAGKTFFDADKLRDLVVFSEGLFQWAFVACEFIKRPGKMTNSAKQHAALMASRTTGGLTKLDTLYNTVLESIVDDDSAPLFRSVMAQILGLYEPLSLDALTALRAKFPLGESSPDDISDVVQHMGSLLSGITNHFTPIRPLHSSFHDYLTDPSRSKKFYVDTSLHTSDIALATLGVLKNGLCFNICRLETSYFPNSDVPDLPAKVEKYIPSCLSYSCRHWAVHLEAVPCNSEVGVQVEDFLEQYFLFWVEALSLLGSLESAASCLISLTSWAKGHVSKGVLNFAMDAHQFILTFANVILKSTPHLYLSALPFAPENSIIHRRYAKQFSRAMHTASGHRDLDWPDCVELFAHNREISTILLSPDGRCIISSSSDGTIRIWDSEIGKALSVLEGHTDYVNSVAVSPNGKYIISGSHDGTVRIWDAQTSKPVLPPLVGHTSAVISVAISPDGKQIISSSYDKTIRTWDVRTGNEIGTPPMYLTDYVSDLFLSPDGSKIFGTVNGTLYMWDFSTKALLADIPHPQKDWIFSFAFSPDAKYIALGSKNTIYILNSHTHDTVGELIGHTDSVFSISFSSNGQYIISGSWDKTVRVWDFETRNLVAGLTTSARCIAVTISPDNTRVIAGSGDGKIHIWNVEKNLESFKDINTRHVAVPVAKTENTSGLLAISSDGKYIASDIGTAVCVWDFTTGEAAFPLFEGPTAKIEYITFLPDSKAILSASDKIHIWDLQTGQRTASESGWDVDAFTCISLSPDGERIASGSEDGTICIWDTITGVPVDVLEGHDDCVHTVRFSRDIKRLVSTSRDQTICVWDADDTNDFELFGTPLESQSETELVAAIITPDGKHVLSSAFWDGEIHMWDVDKGEIVARLDTGDLGHANTAELSADAKLLVSSTSSGSLVIWDTQTCQAVGVPLRGHGHGIKEAMFSPDVKHVISSSRDSIEIRIWNFDSFTGLNPASAIRFSSNQQHSLVDAVSLFRDFDFDLGGDPRDAVEVRPDGWIVGPFNRLLFWIPLRLLPGLFRPRNILVIGEDATQLDLSHFVHGPSWETCYDALDKFRN